MCFKKVSAAQLYVSEPNPLYFGNSENEENPQWTNKNWLKSRFHFSFAEYSNSTNQKFGVLRVMNDDLVQPDRGFSTHPHANMEIVTYIINGELTHRDSMGTCESLGRGSVQFMTAGTGVMHSEHNLHKELPLRFIQMWFTPRQSGLKPNYGSMIGSEESIHNKLTHIVSDVNNPTETKVKINQDVNIYVSVLDKTQPILFKVDENRQAYFLCMEGDVTVKGDHGTEKLSQHDGAEVKGPNSLNIVPESDKSHIMIVEMAKNSDTRFK
jgi:redox-sensitive bicupin YhaK (pirin superfamily)